MLKKTYTVFHWSGFLKRQVDPSNVFVFYVHTSQECLEKEILTATIFKFEFHLENFNYVENMYKSVRKCIDLLLLICSFRVK